MLNELKELSRSLHEAKIFPPDWHPYFKTSSNNSRTYKIFLGSEGHIIDVVKITAEENYNPIKKWESNNGFSFPAFNISSLLRPNNAEDSKIISDYKKSKGKEGNIWAENLEKLINNSFSIWNGIEVNRINNCLKKVSDDVLNQLKDIPMQFKSIAKLCDRAKISSAEIFQTDLITIAVRQINKGNYDVLDILFATSEKDNKKIQIICDLNDWQEFADYPPNHYEVQLWMNRQFIIYSQLEREEKTDSQTKKDVFGESYSQADKKFPSVKLPVSNFTVILRTMFKDNPCQKRYGMIESESFPVGYKVKMELKSALEWLADRERKDKTWSDITGKMDKPTILFAYPTKKLKEAPELAGLIGGEEDLTNHTEASFATVAERVIETLKGISHKSYENEVRIFVLAKMDKARTKVLVNRHYTTEHTIKSAKEWQNGCLNIPNIKIRKFENENLIFKECLIPFPTEAIWCLNTAWIRKGKYPKKIHDISINDALDLLLTKSNEAKELYLRALYAIVRNCTPLLLAVKQENACGKVFPIDKRYEKQVLLLPSILGLLLYKNGIFKGGFMNSPAYLIGRFLSLADDLHLRYCYNVRKGSIPPQLVGNALMSTALETPEKALSILSQRILPYQAWAKTLYGDEKDVGLIKSFLGKIGSVSNQIKEFQIPTECSDTDKAQMLLGYLAWSERSE